jgi:hypothetical protein
MKIIVALVLAAMVLTPSSAFGWKSLATLYDVECVVDCNYDNVSVDNAAPMNFILLAMASLIGLGLFIKSKRLGKYETFSITCERCGRCTRGLKCVMCEAQKQKAQ